MMPSAPGRFSTMTGRPHRPASPSANIRAATSTEPPGAVGVSMRTMRWGQDPACAEPAVGKTCANKEHATSAPSSRRRLLVPLHGLRGGVTSRTVIAGEIIGVTRHGFGFEGYRDACY